MTSPDQGNAVGLSQATNAQLAQLGSWIADDLEQRFLYPGVGAIRQMVRRIATYTDEQTPTGCPICGGDIQRNGKGRPRTYCSPRCRNAARSKVSEMSNWNQGLLSPQGKEQNK